MKKHLLTYSALFCSTAIVLSGCIFGKNKNSNEDSFEGDRLVLNLKNLYFSGWDGSDGYTEVIQDKFKVKINPSSYGYETWNTEVTTQVNGDNLPDVFHFDVESFNFGNTYQYWADGRVLKALPDDLSRWPRIKNLIDNTTNIDSLRYNGKLYGLPLAYNQDDPGKDFSSFTYVYRRDFAKAIGKYKENDIYTYEEFLDLINSLSTYIKSVAGDKAAAIGDVEWGFPSLTNFYKDSPHCYTIRNGKVVNAFATDEYIHGLDDTRPLLLSGKYYDQSATTGKTLVYDEYIADRLAIYYENLSVTNYATLRDKVKARHIAEPGFNNAKLDDMTAIMKVKGPDGKFHLEGSENWFSMTFFNYDISDNKMEKILDILEYLLGPEGTRLATYGKENYDYVLNDGEVELIPERWNKDEFGKYIESEHINGAKFLREMITLNYDTSADDPFVDPQSYAILKAWQDEMKVAKANGQLVTFMEPGNVKWLSTKLKTQNTASMIDEGNKAAMNYCYNKKNYQTKSEYLAKFDIAKWKNTINEINSTLGY